MISAILKLTKLMKIMKIRPMVQIHSAAMLILLIFLFTGCKKNDNQDDIIDGDGNIYETVMIGSQEWITTNLKTTTYNDGTPIPYVTLSAQWKDLTTPGYCWFDNLAGNKEIFGGLYNWYAVNSGKLCPAGFHVPTREEWITMRTFLGNDAGGAMKSVSGLWDSPNEGATNSSGFSALPGGMRTDTDAAEFLYTGEKSIFWSATQTGPSNADTFYIYADQSSLDNYDYSKTLGASVRCIRN
ncbi:MAG: fibrobacter succinogenes major paralogous domain-containing protein [Actinomycetota bacterium]